MRRASSWMAAALAGGALLAGCEKPAPATVDLHVQFTGDVRGRLVPCGCFTGQLGGLTRVATLLGKTASADALRVDVGDAIEGTADYHRIEHRYISQAFARMDYAGANVGVREAELSLEQLRELRRQSAVPLLSANVLERATRTPVCETHRIVRHGSWRIAIIGVVDPRPLRDRLGDGLVVEQMNTAIANLLPSLKNAADFIVLLAFTDEAGLHALAREFFELDLILGGHVAQPSQALERENHSAIFYVTNQSRALGDLHVRLLGPHRMEVRSAEAKLVSDRIPQADAVRNLAIAYRDEIRRAPLEVDDVEKLRADRVPGIKAAAQFVGANACLECHPDAAKAWNASAHARAFATLQAVHADADPNCIACHTVGFGDPSGYRRALGAGDLVNVGCESCHGPGSLHVAQRRQGDGQTDHFRTLGAGDCQKCHHGEFSRPFDWETFWPVVRHR